MTKNNLSDAVGFLRLQSYSFYFEQPIFFLSLFMNNPKELDSETGHLHGIGERVDLSRFMNGTTIKDLML